MKQRTGFLCAAVMLAACGLQGCGQTIGTHADKDQSFHCSFADTYQNLSEENFYSFKSVEGRTMILDYESMSLSALCSKPNCHHTGGDCILHRLSGNNPMFSDNYAYYFVDDVPQIVRNSEDHDELKLGSTLCRYDLTANAEEKLKHIDASAADPCYGWMLLHDTIYYIENTYSRSYDDAWNLISYGNTGGALSLCTIRLSDMQITKLCDLYDVETLTKYYPLTPNSGGVQMKGLFDNKIYFNVSFVGGTDAFAMPDYHLYATYYDLNDGSYHGTPEDYANIDFAGVTYCSEDYLVICRDGQASAWKKGAEQPVIFWDERFSHNCYLMSVFDDTIYCFGCGYDLNMKEDRKINALYGKSVVAKYGDSYIISDYGMQENFEKIPAEQLLK